MPKRGLDVSVCEVFRFYRLVAVKDLVEPLSLIVPRKEVRVTSTSRHVVIYLFTRLKKTVLAVGCFPRGSVPDDSRKPGGHGRLRSGCQGWTGVSNPLVPLNQSS